ncbi:hypothetical protein MJO28_011233 [Puccinia striiformis f. sp. tritici]|uniref:Uncharacterized protein n=1 Tax=Puccinia striiformis f. sp. tritici TaxID=168172 RepID=A0ACC0E3Q2_9BASI|nr:hypothetical protein MJO28_011233 [Puccinia striiformis f. sp. tritici]
MDRQEPGDNVSFGITTQHSGDSGGWSQSFRVFQQANQSLGRPAWSDQGYAPFTGHSYTSAATPSTTAHPHPRPVIQTAPPATAHPHTGPITQTAPAATAPTGRLGGHKAVKSGTRGPNRTPAQIALDEEAAELKRRLKAQKADDRAAEARNWARIKSVAAEAKAKEVEAAATWAKWTEQSTIECAHYVRMIKDEHILDQSRPGFMAFGKFFLNFEDRQENYPLLVDFNNEALLWRYTVIMVNYRAVRDKLAILGKGGLFGCLVDVGLSEDLWLILHEMNQSNDAAKAHGFHEADDDYEDHADIAPLQPDVGSDKLALDPQTDEEDMAPPSQRTTVSRAAASAPAASATPASPSVSTSTARPASIPVGTVTPTPSNKSSSGRPPTTGGSVPRRQGKVKEVPKDTTKSDMMMAMVQKGNNEAARWAVDDRAERVRQEERRVDLAQELRRDTDHIDQLAQAKEEREMVGAQLALERDALALKTREADTRVLEREEDRKAERAEAVRVAKEREEDHKEEREAVKQARVAEAQAQQAFQAALFSMLTGRGPPPAL